MFVVSEFKSQKKISQGLGGEPGNEAMSGQSIFMYTPCTCTYMYMYMYLCTELLE